MVMLEEGHRRPKAPMERVLCGALDAIGAFNPKRHTVMQVLEWIANRAEVSKWHEKEIKQA